MNVRRKYAGLRFLALLIKIAAWLILILSIAAAVWFWMKGVQVAGLRVAGRNLTGILILPFGIYTFIQLYIVGSLLSLLADMEYNTRANATATAKLFSLMEKMESRMEKISTPAISTPPPPPPPPVPDDAVQIAPPVTPTEQLSAPAKLKETQPVAPIEETAPTPPPPPAPAEIVDEVEETASSLVDAAEELVEDVDSAITE